MMQPRQSTEGIRGIYLTDVEAYPGNDRPQRGRQGKMRYYCPIHGGDTQRSFEVRENGGFKCFSCGAWGYLEDREDDTFKQKKERLAATPNRSPQIHNIDLTNIMYDFQAKLYPGTIGERYLKWRGISFATARKYGIGYAANGAWPHQKNGKLVRQWKHGRLVVPHTNPDWKVVNLYGRAIGGDDVPKVDKHSHLPGDRGIFNAPALKQETVMITEGAFDALALLDAGYNACAIFGISGLRFEWIQSKNVIFALDQDEAGNEWINLARTVRLMGKNVFWLDPKTYQGKKDLAEVWQEYQAFDLGDLQGVIEVMEAQKEAAAAIEPIEKDNSDMKTYTDYIQYTYRTNSSLVRWAENHEDIDNVRDPLLSLQECIKKAKRIAEITNDITELDKYTYEMDLVFEVLGQIYKYETEGTL